MLAKPRVGRSGPGEVILHQPFHLIEAFSRGHPRHALQDAFGRKLADGHARADHGHHEVHRAGFEPAYLEAFFHQGFANRLHPLRIEFPERGVDVFCFFDGVHEKVRRTLVPGLARHGDLKTHVAARTDVHAAESSRLHVRVNGAIRL